MNQDLVIPTMLIADLWVVLIQELEANGPQVMAAGEATQEEIVEVNIIMEIQILVITTIPDLAKLAMVKDPTEHATNLIKK